MNQKEIPTKVVLVPLATFNLMWHNAKQEERVIEYEGATLVYKDHKVRSDIALR